MTAELTPGQKDEIRRYVSEGADAEEQRRRRREMAERYGATTAQISAITAWTTIRANRSLRGQGSDTTPAIELTQQEPTSVDAPVETGAPVDLSSLAQDDLLLPVGSVTSSEGGEHIDYGSEVKNAWREAWFRFLHARTPPERRASMKVLCLPGKQCLEIPGYLRLGFSPENIVGVEGGDAQAREEFGRNAARYGIRARIGRLENVMADDKDAYDVVSLDFLGPMCEGYLKIVETICLNDEAVVLVNTMAKRESRKTQELLTENIHHMDGEVDTVIARMSILLHEQGIKPDEMQRRIQSVLEECDPGPVHIADAREYEHNFLLHNFSAPRPAFPDLTERLVKASSFEHRTELNRVLTRMAFAFRENILLCMKGMEVLSPDRFAVLDELDNFFSSLILRGQRIQHFEKHWYHSSVGKTPTPFQSSFAHFVFPEQQYRNLRTSLEALVDYAEPTLRNIANGLKDQTSTKMQIRPVNSLCRGLMMQTESRKSAARFVDLSDEIVAIRGGRRLMKLPIKTLLRDLGGYLSLRKLFPYGKANVQRAMPWNYIGEPLQE